MKHRNKSTEIPQDISTINKLTIKSSHIIVKSITPHESQVAINSKICVKTIVETNEKQIRQLNSYQSDSEYFGNHYRIIWISRPSKTIIETNQTTKFIPIRFRILSRQGILVTTTESFESVVHPMVYLRNVMTTKATTIPLKTTPFRQNPGNKNKINWYNDHNSRRLAIRNNCGFNQLDLLSVIPSNNN